MKKIILSLFLLTAVNLSAAADTLVRWNFNSDPPDAPANVATGTTVPSTGTGTASLVGGASATFSGGSTADAGSTDNSGWNTSDYPSQGNSNKTRGVQFNVNTLGFESIVITWEQRNTATSSKYTRVQYSIDGTTFIDGPVITAFPDTQFHGQTASLATIAGVNDNPNFAFRIVAEFENTATGSGAAGYAADGTGSYSGGSGTIRYDLVTISGVPATGNSLPTISPITNRTIRENESLADVTFTVGDVETPAEELLVTGVSSNPGLVANADITFGGNGANRTVTVTPTFFQSGTAIITLTVTDGGGKVNTTSFVLTVLPDNTVPTLMASFTNYHTLANVALPPIPFAIGDLETAADALEVTVSSSNPTVVPESGAVLAGSGANRTLTITPAPGQTGNSVITITVSDLLLSVSRSFNVMVVPSAGVVLCEPFYYPDGSVTTNSGGLWGTHSGIFGQAKVAAESLRLLSAQTEDVSAVLIGSPYATNHGTVLYASFNVSFSALPNNNADYFAHFREPGGAFHGRVYVSTTNSPPGTFRLGIGNTASTITNAVTVERDLSTGVSYLVVVRYNIDTGISTLWVDPSSESSPGVSATDSPSPDAIASFAFRESTGIGQPTIDNLKIALSFAEAVPGALDTRLTIARAASGIKVSWSAAAADDGYVIETTTSLGPTANWQAPGTAPVRDGNFVVLTVNDPQGNAFFRLRK
jgi:hypothetical protein